MNVQSALKTYAGNRFALLFYVLLIGMGISPLLQPLGVPAGIFEGLLAVTLVTAALALPRGLLRWTVLVVLAAALAARPGAAWLGHTNVSVASLGVWGGVALLAVASSVRFALQGREVGAEQIYAALSAYVLAGLCFGLLYWVLEQLAPGSLSIGGVTGSGDLRIQTTIYFSFVTLASLGYGDILPLSDPARGLAIIETVGGQLYLAVLVARLVSAWRNGE